jgi:PAS domain S-box-containing protein
MLRSYDPQLVVASLVVATLAAYAALDLSGRVARTGGAGRALWLGSGAAALGAGIWGMHFVGMLAFHLADARGRPVPIAYDVAGVVASVGIAVLASAVALAVAARDAVGRAAFATAGLVMGVAIAGMHYVGVAAIRLPGHDASAPGTGAAITYRPALVAAAYAIAVGASLAALWLARRAGGRPGAGGAGAPRPPDAGSLGPRALALPAVVMGVAIAGMHYVGMASARFHPVLPADGAPAAVTQADAVVATPALGAGVTVAVFFILALVLVATTAGRWAGEAEAARVSGSHPAVPAGPAPDPGGRFGRDASGAPSLNLKLAAASAAAGLVLAVGLVAYAGLWQYRRAAERVAHTAEVRGALAQIAAALAESEAAARGYVLAARPGLATEYARAADVARRAVADARQLTADNPAQQRRLAVLPALLAERLAVLDSYMARRRADGVAVLPAIAATVGAAGARGPLLADSIRAVVAEADRAEQALFGTRSALLVRRGRLLDLVLLGGSLAAFALILLVTQAIRRDVALREVAQGRVQAQAAELAAQAEQLEHQQARLEEQLEEEQTLAEELTETNSQLGAAQRAQAAALADARREEARYRALVAAGAQIVWSTAPDGGFVAEQPGWAAFTGQAWAEYRDWGWAEAIHPDDRDATVAAWEMALAAGADGRLDFEHRLRRRDGVYRRMSVRAVPVRADAGDAGDARGGDAVREWVGVHVDVTGERLVQAQREGLIRALERSNRDLDQFAYVASHDLKAPLRGISNLSSWIEEDLAEVMTPDAREQMALLRGRVHRMEALIDGVLQYSRAGRVKAAPERLDTAALAAEVVELLAPRPGARVEVAPLLPVVTAERVPLQQVLLNLVGNALKYAGRDDAVVAVTARPAAGPDGAAPEEAPGRTTAERLVAPAWYRFTVADNGPGIAPQYHERVFGIFQTLQSRDRVEGTGIGLSVVKKIVEGQGGRVWVESAEGDGARFHFTWPAAPAGDDA